MIALPVIPKGVKEEADGSKLYFDFKERCVYGGIIRQEEASAARLVIETERFVALEPYAPRFPLETWIVPLRHESHFEHTDAANLQNLA